MSENFLKGKFREEKLQINLFDQGGEDYFLP